MRMLTDQVIVVTGGTQGLGEDIARRAAEHHAAGLVICGRSEKNGRHVAESISADGCPTIFVQADLASLDDCRAVIHAADARFGRIDGLVNCAASTERGSVYDATPELWERIIAINLRAPFFLMQEAARVMRRTGRGGSIVNIGSINGRGGQTNLTVYSTSKGGLATLTRNAAAALGADRIRVNCINVGWMITPNEDSVQRAEGKPEDWLKQADAQMPFGRILRPTDVSGLVMWLLSPEGELMSGAEIDFDHFKIIGAYR
jgi:NAD(P)-dependent dehydrogenase (short-subunit alcohol dehydrogenase family)